ncbi:hypothetical protein FRD01_11720 [Microvenator marinus]|uniref:Uncharacterized protein n=1 Tax=Microvenator marinus TaxID=2600177 RepID=A0A5B8XRG3_9DELT|nr:hypothetical protein [Microvenator marinus]QED27891.1 hypothetical protein FRD01_11720 [Microvenator marinus]
MGVVYLFTYLIGAFLVFLGARNTIQDAIEGVELENLPMFGFGVLVILLAAILQTLVIKRRGDAGLLEELADFPLKSFLLGMAAWFVPMLVTWIQFELHMNPIYFIPWLTIIGAMAVVWAIARWTTRSHKYSFSIASALVALVGLPLGAISVEAPSSHYQYHLTDLRTSFYNTSTMVRETYDFEAQEPEFYSEQKLIGDEMGELLSALANAKEIDIEEEIAAGRAKYDINGEHILWLQEDGQWVKTEDRESFDFNKAMDDAAKKDAEEHAKKEAARRAAFEKELELRRRGGRLFSSP